jgi:hypothetical protein
MHQQPHRRWHTGAMSSFPRFNVLSVVRAGRFCACPWPATAQTQQAPAASVESGAPALLEKHAALAGQLAQNAYRRPLFLESIDGTNAVSGSAYAVLNSPFATVSEAFKSPNRWCEMLILHLNTKYCRASANESPSTLNVHIGKKTEQELADAFALQFRYQLAGQFSPTTSRRT